MYCRKGETQCNKSSFLDKIPIQSDVVQVVGGIRDFKAPELQFVSMTF